MVKSMKPGSVLVDLAVERGGNVEGAKAGEVADVDGVKIVGYTNVAGRVAPRPRASMPQPLSFIETLVDKKDQGARGQLGRRTGQGDRADPRRRRRATALTKDGAVIHPNFQPARAAA
jgi:NAD(P) transhydrogenase subunit alpha